MAYLSLYRKYRSQTFDELSGQEHVTRTLQNAIRTDRVAHAYLFCGARGTGKTTTARLLAKCLNCEHGPTPEPCNACDNCVRINNGSSMDVIEIDAASNRGIDEIRTLREKVQYAPSQSRKKVYVLDEVHMLTTEAFNALLKTLEEPPAHVLFVLATTEAHRVPTTIVSRCQRFDFRRGSLEQIGARLRYVAEQEGVLLEPAAVARIARGADGSWRDALSLLEQVLASGSRVITLNEVVEVLGSIDADTLHALVEVVRVGDAAAVFTTIDALISAGKDPRQLTRDLVEQFRALLRVAVGAVPAGEPEDPRLAEQAAAFGLPRLVRSLELLAQIEKETRWSDQPRLALEVALVRLTRLDGETVGTGKSPPVCGPAEKQRTPGAPGAASVPGAFPDDAYDPFAIDDLPEPVAVGAAAVAEAPSTAAPVAGDAAPGLDAIRARWRVVVEELKRRKAMTAHALLSDAEPVRLEGETLVVGFQFSPHVELFQRGDNQQQLEAALEAVLGARYRVLPDLLRRADAAGAGGPEPPAAGRGGQTLTTDGGWAQTTSDEPPATGEATSPPADREPGSTDRLIHEVIAIFNGRILDE